MSALPPGEPPAAHKSPGGSGSPGGSPEALAEGGSSPPAPRAESPAAPSAAAPPAAAQSPSAEPAQPPRRGLHSVGRRVIAVFAGLAVIGGGLTSLTGVVDWIGKRFDDPPAPPPERVDARINSVTRRDVRAPLGEYLRTANQSTNNLEAWELRQRGYVYNVRVTITGFLGRRLPLRWAMFDARGTRLSGPIYNQVAGDLKPRGGTHSSTSPIWIPYPEHSGRYFLRFTLEDGRGRPVDEVDARSFQHPPD